MMSDREASQSAEPESGARPDRSFHLQSLSIEGIRGIKELSIPRLGRAALLTDRNGAGKLPGTLGAAALAVHRMCGGGFCGVAAGGGHRERCGYPAISSQWRSDLRCGMCWCQRKR